LILEFHSFASKFVSNNPILSLFLILEFHLCLFHLFSLFWSSICLPHPFSWLFASNNPIIFLYFLATAHPFPFLGYGIPPLFAPFLFFVLVFHLFAPSLFLLLTFHLFSSDSPLFVPSLFLPTTAQSFFLVLEFHLFASNNSIHFLASQLHYLFSFVCQQQPQSLYLPATASSLFLCLQVIAPIFLCLPTTISSLPHTISFVCQQQQPHSFSFVCQWELLTSSNWEENVYGKKPAEGKFLRRKNNEK